ncbi:hypothetical protein EDC04DRAFT_2557580, partial [Pisolithus marmoratus]
LSNITSEESEGRLGACKPATFCENKDVYDDSLQKTIKSDVTIFVTFFNVDNIGLVDVIQCINPMFPACNVP